MTTLDPITAPQLTLPGLKHGFFTRTGGASAGIFSSLNLGRGSSDRAEDVSENRRRVAAHFGRPESALTIAYQVHSDRALRADQPWGDTRPEGDAVVTATSGLICGALAADCAPILLADPQARVVAAAHAGWRGALGGIAERTVEAMCELGARPDQLIAVIGPCIGPESYEVGPEFVEQFVARTSSYRAFFTVVPNSDRFLFDLPAFVLGRLRQAGVTNCTWIGADTCADETRFFSNRRAFKAGEPDFGRLVSAIALD